MERRYLHNGPWQVEDHIERAVGADFLIADTAETFEEDLLVDDLVVFDD